MVNWHGSLAHVNVHHFVICDFVVWFLSTFVLSLLWQVKRATEVSVIYELDGHIYGSSMSICIHYIEFHAVDLNPCPTTYSPHLWLWEQNKKRRRKSVRKAEPFKLMKRTVVMSATGKNSDKALGCPLINEFMWSRVEKAWTTCYNLELSKIPFRMMSVVKEVHGSH